MSLNLYPVRVFFEGFSGHVKCKGVYRAIILPPSIPGLPELAAIDYAPGFFIATMLPAKGRRREMESDEIALVAAWLIKLQEECKCPEPTTISPV